MNLVILIGGVLLGLQFQTEAEQQFVKSAITSGDTRFYEVNTIAGNTIRIRPSAVDSYADSLEAYS